MQDLVSIFILTHNQLKFTKMCLDSLCKSISPVKTPYEVLIYDNGSTDGTVEYLQGLEKGNMIRVIYDKENKGFPFANNRLAEIAKGNYFLLLNNDTVLTKDFLEKLLRCIRSDNKIAVTSCMTTHSSGLQQVPNLPPLKTLEEFEKYATTFQYEERYVDFLVFFCALIRKDVWNEIGGLSEKTGVGCYEDNIFCDLALRKGYKLKIANCFIQHFSGISFGQKKSPEQAQQYLKLLAHNQKVWLKEIGVYKTTSLCMICGDFEKKEALFRCLDSVYLWADEINIIFNYKYFPNHRKINRLKKEIEERYKDKFFDNTKLNY